VIAVADSSVAERPSAEPVDESVEAAAIRDLLERVSTEIGARCKIDITEDDETILAQCSGPDLGLLIGKHGQMIDAVQYLANAIVFRGADERKAIVVDAAGYRDRRRATLDSLAVRSAERVVSSGEELHLEPMTAVERKLVHERMKEFPGVQTRSDGTEPNRHVVISLAEAEPEPEAE
jgi:spoIIIJ-associated protein